MGWTSIYQLFWCSPGVQGFDTLPYIYICISITICGDRYIPKILSQAMAPGDGGPQEQPRLPERHRAPADRHRHEGKGRTFQKHTVSCMEVLCIYIYLLFISYIYICTYTYIYTHLYTYILLYQWYYDYVVFISIFFAWIYNTYWNIYIYIYYYILIHIVIFTII